MEALNVYTITAALADPVRLSVMMYLIRGSASVTELMHHLDVSQSNLSNHLAVLKNANLVKVTSSGRQKIYELANPESAQLIELLLNLQTITPKKEKAVKPIQFARTCYDHLAGKVGVKLFNVLLEKKAIQYSGEYVEDRPFAMKDMELGPGAKPIFEKLGVDLASLNARRRFAFACMDWTERTPHLAGALGAAICRALLEKKWIARKPESRTIALTTIGKQELQNLTGLAFDQ
jgi:DNA-binding transcriptional ArsR family regulator